MGVIAIAAEVVGARVGLADSTFVPVSLGSAAGVVLRAEYVHHVAEAEGRSAAGHQGSGRVARRGARTLTARTGDWFTGLQAISTENGAVFIEGTSVWLESSTEQLVPAGDPTIVILGVNDITVHPEVPPIMFHRSIFRCLDDAPNQHLLAMER